MRNSDLALKIWHALKEHGQIKGLGLAKALIIERVLDENLGNPAKHSADGSICVKCGLPYSGDYKNHLPFCTKRRHP